MAKYLINSADIEIEEVSGTENLKLNLADGNAVEQMVGDLSNLTTTSKSNVVNSINEVNGELTNLNTYSSTETVIGKWINNKPVYRKVINSYGTTGDNVALPHNINYFKQLVNYCLVAGDSGLSYVSNNTIYDLWINTVDTTNINMKIAGAYNNWQIYIILEYIKTRD